MNTAVRRFAIVTGVAAPALKGFGTQEPHEFGWADVPVDVNASFVVPNEYWDERGSSFKVTKKVDGADVEETKPVSSSVTQQRNRIRTNFDAWRNSKDGPGDKVALAMTAAFNDAVDPKHEHPIGVRCWVIPREAETEEQAAHAKQDTTPQTPKAPAKGRGKK